MKTKRLDFPSIKSSHKAGLIYFDNAATTHKPQSVIDAINRVYTSSYAPVHRAIYEAAELMTKQFEAVRASVASFINAKDPTEIVFTRNTTEGLNLVAQAWARPSFPSEMKDGELVVTALEHHSNLVPWLALAQERGARVCTIPVYDDLTLNLTNLEQIITPKTRLVALTLSSQIAGPTCPEAVRKIIAAAHAVGARVVVDAAQMPAHQALDVQALGAEFVAFSGHKMFGPTGVGVLYIKKTMHEQIKPLFTGGGMVYSVEGAIAHYRKMPALLEAGTPDIAGVIGLGAAIDYLKHRVDYASIAEHESQLMTELLAGLTTMPKLKLLGLPENLVKGHLACFTLPDKHPHDIAAALAVRNICVRAGDHCSQPVHKRIGITGSVRVSLALYNTQEDIAALLHALHKL